MKPTPGMTFVVTEEGYIQGGKQWPVGAKGVVIPTHDSYYIDVKINGIVSKGWAPYRWGTYFKPTKKISVII